MHDERTPTPMSASGRWSRATLVAISGIFLLGGCKPAADRSTSTSEPTGTGSVAPPTAPSASAAEPKTDTDVPSHEIVKKDITDDAIKTQVNWWVVVPKATTAAQLDVLLPALHKQAKTTVTSKFRPAPNAFYIFVYDHPTKGEGDTSWIGRIAKSAADPEATFDNRLSEPDPATTAITATSTPTADSADCAAACRKFKEAERIESELCNADEEGNMPENYDEAKCMAATEKSMEVAGGLPCVCP